jgi:RsiW-degrading membrane proteinase PrsW (M82 family)
MGILFILILISSAPAIAAFVWFRIERSPFALPSFSVSLLAGAASFFPALFFQRIFLVSGIFQFSGRWGLFAEIFIRIALSEELSRFIILLILFSIIKLFNLALKPLVSMPATVGLIAGLGFAILESALYGAENPGNALLRAFTAAPLHGACAARIGYSAAMIGKGPARSISRFLSAVAIHGAYNFILIMPGVFPLVAAILIVITALASAIQMARNEMGYEEMGRDEID